MLSFYKASAKVLVKHHALRSVCLTPALITSSRRHFSEKKAGDGEVEAETPKPAAPSVPFDLLKFVKAEADNISELFRKIDRPRAPKRRLLDPDVAASPQPDFTETEIYYDKDGNRIMKQRTEEDLKEEANEKFTEDQANSENGEKQDDKKDQPSALILNTDHITVWGKRMDSFKEAVRGSAVVKPIVRLGATLETSENPLARRINNLRWDAKDKAEEIREKYETAQVGSLATIRRLNDKATGTTPAEVALEQLLAIDPYFNLEDFQEDMVTYQIPVALTAFFQGKKDVIISAFGSNAREAVLSIVADQVHKGRHPDATILDINFNGVEPKDFVMFEHKPLIKLTVIVQMIDCVRNSKGEVIEGSPGNISSFYFSMSLQRELSNPDFDWRIVDFAYQKMYGIGAN